MPTRTQLTLDGLSALAAGSWCGINFWRCRHAHCLVTGGGWSALAIVAFVAAGLGLDALAGYWTLVFLAIFAIGLAFELVWFLIHRTNAPTSQPSTSARSTDDGQPTDREGHHDDQRIDPFTAPLDDPARLSSIFAEHGFVHVPQVLPEPEVTRLRDAALHAVPADQPAQRIDAVGLVSTTDGWEHHSSPPELALHPRLGRIAQALTGGPLRIWGGEVLVKRAHENQPTGLHDDQTTELLTSRAWVALVDVPVERGCLSFLPRSHRRPDPERIALTQASPGDRAMPGRRMMRGPSCGAFLTGARPHQHGRPRSRLMARDGQRVLESRRDASNRENTIKIHLRPSRARLG